MNTIKAKLIKEIIEQSGINCEISEVAKGSTMKTGFCLGSGLTRPQIYLEDLHGSPEEIASYIVNWYNNEMKDNIPEININDIKDWTKVKSNLTVVLRKHMDEGIFIPLNDEIDITIKLLLPDLLLSDVKVGEKEASIRVTENLLRIWEKSIDEVYQTALINDSKKSYEYIDMISILYNNFNKNSIKDIDSISMITISNNKWINGASVILQKEIMDKLAEIAESDLIIIPSSVHESIILPYTNEIKKTELMEMIKTVNQQEISPEEVLADVPFLYKKGIGITEFPDESLNK